MRDAVLSCEYVRPTMNALLARWDATYGYRATDLPPSKTDSSDSLFMMASFSGDGAGASALSYGMLQEIARTPIAWEGRQERLVDELNSIHAVSGAASPQPIMPSMAIALFRISRLASSARIESVALSGFEFAQRQFDLICSGLNQTPLSVAASSSVLPLLLSPITVTNYADTGESQSPAHFTEQRPTA